MNTDRLAERVTLPRGEQNAQNFSEAAKFHIRDNFGDLSVLVENMSRLGNFRGPTKKAKELGFEKIANALGELAEKAGGAGFIAVSLIGNSRARIDMALIDLDQIAIENSGVPGKKQDRTISKNPERELAEKMEMKSLPPKLRGQAFYIFK